MNRRTWKAALLPLLLSAEFGFCAAGGIRQLTVPSDTLLRVEVIQRCHLRKGSPAEGRLLEPIYADNRLLVPSGAVLRGTIVAVRPAGHHARLDAKFHGDFTPLRVPVIEWTTLTRGDGTEYPIRAESTTGAGGILYFRTSPPAHVSLIRRAWNSFLGSKNAALDSVRAPGKGARLERFFWSQMPYHPQYLEAGTQYEMRLTADFRAAVGPLPLLADPAQPEPLHEQIAVHSRLEGDLNSATAQPGDPVKAIVTQPVRNDQDQLILPQNSVLYGRVLSASASRRWGHNGTLRFAFDRVSWPSGFEQNVEATPTAVESNASARLSVDQEGGVARQNQHSVAAPLVMGLLSGSAIGDEDGGVGTAAVSSNGFAIAGHLAAILSGSRYVGGGIGAVATGRSIYTHWLAHGKETRFGPDTEIVVEMSPAEAHRMSPAQ